MIWGSGILVMWSQNETKLFGMRMEIQILQSQNETEYYGRRGEGGRERGRERNQTECSNIFKDKDAMAPGILVLWSWIVWYETGNLNTPISE